MAELFTGRVAVVTGAGSGIGRAAATAFAREGAAVVVADIDADAAGETATLIADGGGPAVPVATDVGRAEQVRHMVEVAEQTYGRLDFLFNNAGISGFTNGRMGEMDEELFDRLWAVNVKGVWLGIKYAVPAMTRTGGGAIVNTASTMGLVGQRFSGPYAATKHAVVGLTRTAAIEYGRDGVRVNAVCPGGIATPLTDAFKDTFTAQEWDARNQQAFPATGRYGTPDEVAAAVVFLCSDAASNVHGVALPVDGGYTAQ